MTGSFAFDRFVLDPGDRRLRADGMPVELNGRYFDALALLVREQGRLVSKDRFLGEVWSGVPVTDEALTQCIKTLRRQLGDDAANPRFIETVPKHGYRFIALVEQLDSREAAGSIRAEPRHSFFPEALGGMAGATVAGMLGGMVYGFAAASAVGPGAISLLLVVLCATMLVAAIGGTAVSFAIASTALAPRQSAAWPVFAGAAGGLFVGAFGNLLGHDGFAMLVGRSPGPITGALEGLLLDAGVGAGAALARGRDFARAAGIASFTGAAAGAVIALLGGKLMLGSLQQLGAGFPGSALRLNGVLPGELGRFVTDASEGALFSAGVVTGMFLAGSRTQRR